MKPIVSHLLHAIMGSVFGAALVYYYVFAQTVNWYYMFGYVSFVTPMVVFVINRKGRILGRKALAQTALISLLITLALGIIHKVFESAF